MEIQFGEQMTIDEWLGIKKLPRNDSNGWLVDILGENYDGSEVILDSFVKADSVINDPKYKKIMCSISGGKDSSVMLDILHKVDRDKKIDYVYIDTGLEYGAIKKHLDYLEQRYDIQIKRVHADMPIPLAVYNTGQPFISKRVAEMIYRLQLHDFDWSDDTFDNHMRRFPNCQEGLKWWDNQHDGGAKSNFNICRHRALKEFMMDNPPWFKISQKCCQYVKKNSLHKAQKYGNYDLSCYGVRVKEGGQRATVYSGCFTEHSYNNIAEYRPIHWYSNEDISEYENRFCILQSEAYTTMGLPRTGCCGCPFGRDFEFELQVIKQFEPKLYVAVNNIFADSYKYTRMFHQYRAEHKDVQINTTQN